MLPFLTPLFKVIVAELVISAGKKVIEAIEEELSDEEED
jgi:hypothetical protein